MMLKFQLGLGSVAASLLICSACSTRPGTGVAAQSAASPSLRGDSSKSAPIANPSGGDLVKRSTFPNPNSLPWMPLFLEPAKGEAGPKEGAYCLRIDH